MSAPREAGAKINLRRSAASLLAADEPPPVSVDRESGSSEILLVCDHAANLLPRSLDTLGLSETERASHIAWDIGAAGVMRLLGERLDASSVAQGYSRLVIDCNRPLAAEDSIPPLSEWTPIAGNEGLGEDERAARRGEIFEPYHQRIRALLDERARARRKTVLVAIHSFTPSYRGVARPWQIGVMYGQDARLARVVLSLLRRDERLLVGDNEPYALEADIDYTLPVHGEARGLAHLGFEIRQDLIADEAGQKTWAGRLASLLKQAVATLD